MEQKQMEMIMNDRSEQVTELKDISGRVIAYKCPVCSQAYPTSGLAEACITDHASVLCD